MKPPRLAVFINTLLAGGAERATVTLVRGLAARGVTLDLIVARATGPYLDLVRDSARVIDLGARRMPGALRPLARYLSQVRPAALLTMLTHASVVGIAAARLASHRPRIVVREGALVARAAREAHTFRARMLPHLARWTYRYADVVLANGLGVAQDLRDRLGVPDETLRIVPNPIDADHLRRSAAAPVPHPWLADRETPVVLAVGRLAPEKDLETLLRAFSRLRADRRVRLILLGEGPERPRLERVVRSVGLDDVVALPGLDVNPYAWMARARVVAMASRLEGNPNVLAEAMALGVPVTATDCASGPAELLAGGLGPLAPVGDDVRLAAGIAACLDRPVAAAALRARVASHALDPVLDRYLDALGIESPARPS